MRLNEGVVHNLVLQGRVPTRTHLVNVCACAHSLGAVHDFFTKVVSQGFLQKQVLAVHDNLEGFSCTNSKMLAYASTNIDSCISVKLYNRQAIGTYNNVASYKAIMYVTTNLP